MPLPRAKPPIPTEVAAKGDGKSEKTEGKAENGKNGKNGKSDSGKSGDAKNAKARQQPGKPKPGT
jgi:hypothetical protein